VLQALVHISFSIYQFSVTQVEETATLHVIARQCVAMNQEIMELVYIIAAYYTSVLCAPSSDIKLRFLNIASDLVSSEKV